MLKTKKKTHNTNIANMKTVIGTQTDKQTNLKAMKPSPKRKVFYVGRLDQQCTAKELSEHINELKIETSAEFRVCIYETDSAEFMNAENWPDQIIVREWCFNDLSANVVNDLKSKRGGGVGVFIKHDIKYVVNDNSAFDDENVDVLCVDIESGHASSRGVLKVIAIYRPPNYKFEPFLNKINLILHAIKPADKTVIVGDFNVNLLDNDSNDSKDFQNLLFSFCLEITLHQ
ncbi:hypothetical protein HELRODRAFT_164394 [Helobdella robusta]|uniref:Endonuclease/exonuclease/phosphatase domain-containing protein n=1 Tax=Helobdella robusta TaxID=6412 RepID=T1EVD5_HELRO|nr:hypothetical protein HELRODRAFT_164394 [Helobdella robusta]ESN94538.1 hypothetical protein HELRODRAFT_164394 [Helobdella robusta]